MQLLALFHLSGSSTFPVSWLAQTLATSRSSPARGTGRAGLRRSLQTAFAGDGSAATRSIASTSLTAQSGPPLLLPRSPADTKHRSTGPGRPAFPALRVQDTCIRRNGVRGATVVTSQDQIERVEVFLPSGPKPREYGQGVQGVRTNPQATASLWTDPVCWAAMPTQSSGCVREGPDLTRTVRRRERRTAGRRARSPATGRSEDPGRQTLRPRGVAPPRGNRCVPRRGLRRSGCRACIVGPPRARHRSPCRLDRTRLALTRKLSRRMPERANDHRAPRLERRSSVRGRRARARAPRRRLRPATASRPGADLAREGGRSRSAARRRMVEPEAARRRPWARRARPSTCFPSRSCA